MTQTLERRVARLEAGRGVPGGELTMSDLLSVIEEVAATERGRAYLGEVGALARLDAGEASQRAFRTRPDVAASCPPPELTPGRWPYLRANHAWWETTYPGDGPRPTATREELAARLAAWRVREGLSPPDVPRPGAKGRKGAEARVRRGAGRAVRPDPGGRGPLHGGASAGVPGATTGGKLPEDTHRQLLERCRMGPDGRPEEEGR